MRGRYTLYRSNQLKTRYHLTDTSADELLADLNDRYNIAPSQEAVVIINNTNGSPAIALMRWGYMPPWFRTPKDIFKYKTFNARAEGIFEKPTWKAAIRYHRALVPCTGFYEWKQQADGKQPFLITPQNEALFSFAGLYGIWHDAQGHEWHTYSIVTTAANKDMQAVHDRMPVILHREDEASWLDTALDDPDTLKTFLAPYPNGQLNMYEVSKEVNSSRSDLASFITPLNSQ